MRSDISKKTTTSVGVEESKRTNINTSVGAEESKRTNITTVLAAILMIRSGSA